MRSSEVGPYAGPPRRQRFNFCLTVAEFRTRMRGFRPFGFVLAQTAALTLAAGVTLWLVARLPGYGGGGAGLGLGGIVLPVVLFAQAAMLLLTVPALTAGSIAMEREKRTFDSLRVTTLRPAEIVGGKLLCAVAFSAVLVVSSLPIAAWSALLGGVSPEQIGLSYLGLMILALWVAAVGMACSAVFTRTIPAIASAYGVASAAVIGGPLLLGLVMGTLSLAGGSTADEGAVVVVFAILVAFSIVALRSLHIATAGWRRPFRSAAVASAAVCLIGTIPLVTLATDAGNDPIELLLVFWPPATLAPALSDIGTNMSSMAIGLLASAAHLSLALILWQLAVEVLSKKKS